MNVHDAIYSRRAVRSYTPRVVDDATIDTLLRAAVQAPSAMNRQPWQFALVQDKARLHAYSERAKAMLLEAAGATATADGKAQHYAALLRSPAFNIFYDAGTLIAIGVADHGLYAEADCWLAAGNLMLTARELGLGSCCIGFAVPLLGTAAMMEELGFPPTGRIVAPIIVGYPAVEPPVVARTPPKVSAWLR